MASKEDDGIPKELKEKLAKFDTDLSEVEQAIKPLLSTNRVELSEKMEAIDVAKTDLVAAYAINSLFWMYLNVSGINPKEHAVKQELTRIQSYMQRVKETEDKINSSKRAPRLNKEGAKRFVRSALWQAAQKQGQSEGSVESPRHSKHVETSEDKKGSSRKRKRKDDT